MRLSLPAVLHRTSQQYGDSQLLHSNFPCSVEVQSVDVSQYLESTCEITYIEKELEGFCQ